MNFQFVCFDEEFYHGNKELLSQISIISHQSPPTTSIIPPFLSHPRPCQRFNHPQRTTEVPEIHRDNKLSSIVIHFK